MKVWIILLSMLAAGCTWWWNTRDVTKGGRQPLNRRLKVITRSLAAGVGVYFFLMAIAFMYLLIANK
ncbi:hypothetical protein H0A65_00310 [Alcaligenaceae bacterium]|nr:hypothetical protein [Alcaligenaceae bacterium]